MIPAGPVRGRDSHRKPRASGDDPAGMIVDTIVNA